MLEKIVCRKQADISLPTYKPEILLKHSSAVEEKVSNIILSYNVPQIDDVFDVNEKITQMETAIAGGFKLITLNFPFNKMDPNKQKREIQIVRTILEAKKRELGLGMVIIGGNPGSGRGITGVPTIDFVAEVTYIIGKHHLDGISLYVGTYPTNLAEPKDLLKSWALGSFTEIQTDELIKTQIDIAKNYAKNFPELTGFITQQANNPLLIAKYLTELMPVIPGKEVYLGTASQGKTYSKFVIRNQLEEITGDTRFGSANSQLELIYLMSLPRNWEYIKKITGKALEPINLDMITRIFSARGIGTNVMADVYKILGEGGQLTKEQMNLLMYHVNVYGSSSKVTGENVEGAMNVKEQVINTGHEISSIIVPEKSPINIRGTNLKIVPIEKIEEESQKSNTRSAPVLELHDSNIIGDLIRQKEGAL